MLTLLMAGMLASAVPVAAQHPGTAPAAATASAYTPATGDAWVDRQLVDINGYAARYPDAFIDELVRYAGARPAYVDALMREHGWTPADVYLACFWGHVSATGCREWVRARAGLPGSGWKVVLESGDAPPDNLQWRALRHAIVASYDHWDRPIRLDPLLQRQLGDRARRDAAARKAQ